MKQIVSVVAGLVLGIITNYIYDHLRQIHVLPDKPTVRVLSVLTFLVFTLIFLVAWPDLDTPKVADQHPLALSFTATSMPNPTVMNTPELTSTSTPPLPTSSPIPTATATVQPHEFGGRIAFIDFYHDIYVMNADGSNKTRVVAGNGTYKHSLDWSPDGERIVFSLFGASPGAMYVVDADGANLTRITNNKYAHSYPNWSPDGERIAFASDRNDDSDRYDGENDIFVMNADGSSQINLTANNYPEYEPKWSPDGHLILFTSHRNTTGVYKMNADGSSQVALTSSDDFSATWSPDGKYIAFVSHRDADGGEIYVMNADGSNQTNISRSPFSDQTPAWSPDGKYIAFVSYRDGEGIYVMNADGSDQRRLTTSGQQPAWSR